MAVVFISHASRDGAQAATLKSWLHEQGFETIFLDLDREVGLTVGDDWEKRLYREIDRSHAVILILTPAWQASKWCFAEYTQARALGKAVLPVIAADLDAGSLPADIQRLDLRRDRETALAQLARALNQIATATQDGFDWDINRPPFPGLLAFQEEDAAIYFGRDEELRAFGELLRRKLAYGAPRLIALLGASGSGKSSFLRAGVLPRLRRQDTGRWIVLPTFRPGARPLAELADSIALALGETGTWQSWQERLSGDAVLEALQELVRQLRQKMLAREAQVLVPVDQAEEIFSLSTPEQRRKFLDILNLIHMQDLPIVTVLAMRSDYFEPLQVAENLTAAFEEFSLKPLAPERIRQIIEGPARVAGLTVEPGLVDSAVRDAVSGDALPLLAFTLRELYDRHGKDQVLTASEYQSLGNPQADLSPLENAVRQAADSTLLAARPSEEDLRALRDAFVPALVRINHEGQYVKRAAAWTALPAKAHALLQRLIDARLLVSRQEGGEHVIEVAHEALLRKWPRLTGWLNEEREFLVGKNQLEQDLREWQSQAKADRAAALLSGLKLSRAESWLIRHPQRLGPEERGFIQESIAARDESRNRRARLRRILTLGTAAASLVLAGLSVFLFIFAQQARDAQFETYISRSDLSASLALRLFEQDKPLLGLKVARDSAPREITEATPLTPRLELALMRAVSLVGDQATLLHPDGSVLDFAWSPDSQIVATATVTDGIRVWRAETGELIKWLTPKVQPDYVLLEDHEAVAFSADGRRLATFFDDQVQVWDTQSWEELDHMACAREDSTGRVRISNDGRFVAAICDDIQVLEVGHEFLDLPEWAKGGFEVQFVTGAATLSLRFQSGLALADLSKPLPLDEPEHWPVDPLSVPDMPGGGWRLVGGDSRAIFRTEEDVIGFDLPSMQEVYRWSPVEFFRYSENAQWLAIANNAALSEVDYLVLNAVRGGIAGQGNWRFVGAVYRAATQAISVSNSGRLLALGTDRGLTILDLDREQEVFSTACAATSLGVERVQFSADDTRVAILCNGAVQVHRIRTPPDRVVAGPDDGGSWANGLAALSEPGRFLALRQQADGSRSFVTLDGASGELVGSSPAIEAEIVEWTLHKPSGKVFWRGYGAEFGSWTVGTDEVTHYQGGTYPVDAFGISSDGTLLATFDNRAVIRRYRAADARPMREWRLLGGTDTEPISPNLFVFSPDLEHLAVFSQAEITSDNTLMVVSPGDNVIAAICADETMVAPSAFSFSEENDRLMVMSSDRRMYTLPIDAAVHDEESRTLGASECMAQLAQVLSHPDEYGFNAYSKEFLHVVSTRARAVFSLGADQPLELIDLADDRLITDLVPQFTFDRQVVFDKEQRVVAVESAMGSTLDIFDLDSGTRLKTLHVPSIMQRGYPQGDLPDVTPNLANTLVAFDSSASFFAVQLEDGSIAVYSLNLHRGQALIDAIWGIVPQEMTDEDRRQIFEFRIRYPRTVAYG